MAGATLERRVRAAALAFALASIPGAAGALTQNGTLAPAASDTDFYQVTCSNDGSGAPMSLVTQVLDAPPVGAPIVSVQSQKASPAVATNSSDALDGDAGASPAAASNGGAGTYDVFVDKSGAGAENYTLTVQCTTGLNGGGASAGTAIVAVSVGALTVPALAPAPLALLLAAFGALGVASLRGRRRAPIRGRR